MKLLSNIFLFLAYTLVCSIVVVAISFVVAVFYSYFSGESSNMFHQPLFWIISGVLSVATIIGMFMSLVYDLKYEKKQTIEDMTHNSRIDDKINLN
jgi:tetrahydromethanopterin S-methyltransferase subunit D